MKAKISISVDEDVLSQVEKVLKEGFFRNKSHVFEYSLKKFLDQK